MNPLVEIDRLTSFFPEDKGLIAKAEHCAASLTPEPYHTLLVHDHHMTVAMEDFHGSPVSVQVLNERVEGDIYLRRIVLHRQSDGAPVQFGLVRFDLSYVTPSVRQEILARKTPLGRILITHNVLRHIDLGAIVKIWAGPALATEFRCPTNAVTYGRLATIFCNHQPAVDLLEISVPLPDSPAA